MMNDLDDNLSAGIEDYLLSLADSLNLAQRQLNNNVVRDASGGAISYQLPKLDFEMKMSLSLQDGQQQGSHTSQPTPGGNIATSLVARPKLMAKTISQYSNSAESAVSIIRGSFIAVPVNGGKPLPRIYTDIKQISPTQKQLIVTLMSDTGEAVAGALVEYNIDFNLIETGGFPVGMSSSSGFEFGVRTTNDAGIAVNILNIDHDLGGMPIPVVIDALGQTETIYF